MNDRLKALADAGVSIWLDDLSRERLETGNLADLMKNSHVVGVTSNPAIFQAALADGERYDPQVRELAAAGADHHVGALRQQRIDELRRVMRVVSAVAVGHDVDVGVDIGEHPAHAVLDLLAVAVPQPIFFFCFNAHPNEDRSA